MGMHIRKCIHRLRTSIRKKEHGVQESETWQANSGISCGFLGLSHHHIMRTAGASGGPLMASDIRRYGHTCRSEECVRQEAPIGLGRWPCTERSACIRRHETRYTQKSDCLLYFINIHASIPSCLVTTPCLYMILNQGFTNKDSTLSTAANRVLTGSLEAAQK